MLPTPVLSVSGKGFARLRISAWHFSPAPPILYAVRAIVYHKSRVLSRVLRDFSGSEAPGTPRLSRRRHLLSLPRWKTQRRLALRGTGYPCPGGEDHLKRRSSSPPVPPLLGCRHCSPVPRLNCHATRGIVNARRAGNAGGKPSAGDMDGAGRASAARVQSRGCKGRSPLHKKTLILPLPRRGRGLGG